MPNKSGPAAVIAQRRAFKKHHTKSTSWYVYVCIFPELGGTWHEKVVGTQIVLRPGVLHF